MISDSEINRVRMEELESTVQKHVENLCTFLPKHVERWRTLLEETKKPSRALSNYADQLRHVEKASIDYIEEFTKLQEMVTSSISEEIEDELQLLKCSIDGLNQANQTLKNKLSTLERSTIDLNWDSDTPLLKGGPFQPPLRRILQEGLKFWLYFSNAMKVINEHFKNVDVHSEKFMKSFEQSFEINLEHKNVTWILAITQYVNNEKE